MQKYELVNIDQTTFTANLEHLLKEESILFNATEIAKCYKKKVEDYLRLNSTQEYIQIVVNEFNSKDGISRNKNEYNADDFVIVKRGKYGGTWLHNELVLDFARWCDRLFARKLDKWTKAKIADERNRKQERSLARLEYPAMTDAIQADHEEPKPYHYSNEADMINRIVLGTTAKKYCEDNKIDRLKLREELPKEHISKIQVLQKHNTVLIEQNFPFSERKEMLKKQFYRMVIG